MNYSKRLNIPLAVMMLILSSVFAAFAATDMSVLDYTAGTGTITTTITRTARDLNEGISGGALNQVTYVATSTSGSTTAGLTGNTQPIKAMKVSEDSPIASGSMQKGVLYFVWQASPSFMLRYQYRDATGTCYISAPGTWTVMP